MRVTGIVLLVIGAIICLVAVNMKVTVTTEPQTIGGIEIPSQTVNNIGLMDDRRNTLLVGGLGLLVGVVLFTVGSLQRRPVAVGSDEGATFTPGSDTKKCPYCAEDIKAQAVVCRYCGRDLPAGECVEALAEVPAAMTVAYEAWLKSCGQEDYEAFRRASAQAASQLPSDTTAAQLEATFPGIPIDFGELVALIPAEEDPYTSTSACDRSVEMTAAAVADDGLPANEIASEEISVQSEDAQLAPRRHRAVLIVSAVIAAAVAALLIAFLAGAPIPLLSHTRDTPANAAVKAGIHSIQDGVEFYKAQTGAYPYGNQVSRKNLAAYVKTWPENPYTHLPMTSGTHSGDFYYTLDSANDVFSLTGYGDGDKAIIAVP